MDLLIGLKGEMSNIQVFQEGFGRAWQSGGRRGVFAAGSIDANGIS